MSHAAAETLLDDAIYPNSVTTSYAYDDLNRLTTLAATHTPTSTPVTNFGYQYDAAGNRTQKSTIEFTEDYKYDPLQRLTRADRTNPGATPPNQWTWNYDAVGNRTSAQKDQEATTSTHNEKNQLLQTSGGGKMLWRGVLDEPGTAAFSAASASINGQPARMLAGNVFEATLDLPAGANTVTIQAEDGSGNVASQSYSVNVLGVPATYTYDANGNLATKTEGADAWVYTWNVMNQLTIVTKNAATVATYQYDPEGRRVQRSGASTVTSWMYDGADIVRQGRVDAGLAASTHFIHGHGIDEPLAAESSASGLTYLHADAAASVVLHTDGSAAAVDQLSYDAWGNVQAGSPSPFGYTGREWDPAVGLWFYRARYYDPSAGRFVSEDPIGFGGGVNYFTYADSNPISLSDPSGLLTWRGDRRMRVVKGMEPGHGRTYPSENIFASCKCEGGSWRLDFIVTVNFDAYAASKETLDHESEHIAIHVRNYMEMLYWLLPAERQPYPTEPECRQAGAKARAEMEKHRDTLDKGQKDNDTTMSWYMSEAKKKILGFK